MFSFYQPVQTVPARQNQSSRQQFNSVLNANHLIGQQVKINRGGPDSVEGVLIAIPGDFLVVLSKTGIIYVNGMHVKSITEGGNASGGKSDGGKSSGGRTSGGRSLGSRSTNFIRASSFQSLLSKMRHKHIQINSGGPEKLDGFLAEISRDNVLVIVDRQLVRIPIFHIKNVGLSNQGQNNKSNKNKNNKSNNNNKSGNKQSGGNKSGGKNSGGKNSGGGGRGQNRGNARR